MSDAPVLPRMHPVRQQFPESPPFDPTEVVRQFETFRPHLRPGQSIALAVGSRGITNLREIVRTLVNCLRKAGTHPFIIPAMGSHAGATPEGQTEILAGYGISETDLGIPVRASLATRVVGTTEFGTPVPVAEEALAADGILVVNRIKPHTDFFGEIGSGIIKMSVVGLGKRQGASTFHRAACRFGYAEMLLATFRVVAENTPLLGGLAILEDQHHQTARLEALRPAEFEARERVLFQESRQLLARLPFEEIDLLIVDRIGKNISGAGMDPNVIGRSVHGYNSLLNATNDGPPFVRRIYVRDLTPETHGNAIGIGLADFTSRRLVDALDARATAINSLTAMVPGVAKLPITCDSDREAIQMALDTLAPAPLADRRIVRISDTLNLDTLWISAALFSRCPPSVESIQPAESPDIYFDAFGNFLE